MRWLGRPEVVDVPGQRLQPAGTPLEHQHAVQAVLAVLQGTLKLDMPLAGLVVRQRQRSLHAHDQQSIRVRPDAVSACMPISPAQCQVAFFNHAHSALMCAIRTGLYASETSGLNQLTADADEGRRGG